MIFIPILAADHSEDKFQEAFVGGDMVYRYAVIMHILATIVHVTEWYTLFENDRSTRNLETLIEIGKIFLIPL